MVLIVCLLVVVVDCSLCFGCVVNSVDDVGCVYCSLRLLTYLIGLGLVDLDCCFLVSCGYCGA